MRACWWLPGPRVTQCDRLGRPQGISPATEAAQGALLGHLNAKIAMSERKVAQITKEHDQAAQDANDHHHDLPPAKLEGQGHLPRAPNFGNL